MLDFWSPSVFMGEDAEWYRLCCLAKDEFYLVCWLSRVFHLSPLLNCHMDIKVFCCREFCDFKAYRQSCVKDLTISELWCENKLVSI